jgi:hypothetical protein
MVTLAGLLALALAVEARAGEAGSWANWLGGSALLAAGVVASGERGTRWPGVLLLMAGLTALLPLAVIYTTDTRAEPSTVRAVLVIVATATVLTRILYREPFREFRCAPRAYSIQTSRHTHRISCAARSGHSRLPS